MRYLFIYAAIYLLVFPQTAFGFTGHEGDRLDKTFLNNQGPAIHLHRKIQSIESIDMSRVNNRRILVRLKEDEMFDPAQTEVQSVETSQVLQNHHIKIVRVSPSVDFQEKLGLLRKNPNVVYAVPDYIRRVRNYQPNDPGLSQQWYLDAIHMPAAWDLQKGSSDITVAVLDTGVDLDHPDLKGHLLPGYDFVNGDSNPADDNGHGTHVAGIISATANNKTGIAGVAFNTKILPVKIANENGVIVSSRSVSGIYYAIKHGADVINMSYGSIGPNQAELEALQDAFNKGIVLVAASGNTGSQILEFPASYYPVISVAATDRNHQYTSFSTWGPMVDVAAPGLDIFSTDITGNGGYSAKSYSAESGTSFSAPMISGLAALLKAEHPKWGPNQIEWALELGVMQSEGKRWSQHLGYGVVDAEKILSINLPSTRDDVPESFDKAFTLKNGEVYAEKINMPGDQDLYHLNVSQCGKMTIRFPEVSSPNDLHAVVGVQLKDREIYAKHVMDDKGIGGEEIYSFQIAPGNYYLIVGDMNKHWSSRSYKVTGLLESTDELMIFPDSRNHWAKREISYLTKCGIIEGFPNGTFHPDESITRAQAAKIISEELRLPPNESDFPDVE
ncbi:MAG TPA: S8 family serine peptidase, partial [Bacillales bacterium]